ncbi:MAG: ADP-ribosylation factor family protein [Candidatus Hodarchaeales archaeon]|jgi:small GTP-binding protein
MSFLSRLKDIWAKEKLTVKVSWIGLDQAGKTTLIRRITTGHFDDGTKRTLGMNVDEFTSSGIRFVAWDIGGQVTFRESLWESYISGSMGLIYVIDAADPDRFPEAKEELWKFVINNPKVTGIPILVLANKQDLPVAQTAGLVARSLDLHKVTDHSYAIVPTSAKSGFNVEEALEWLRRRMTEKIKHL